MTPPRFDTLKYVKTLKAAGFEEKQAEALAEAQTSLQEQVETFRQKERTTKGDLQAAEARLQTRIAEAKAETIQWLCGVAAAQAVFILAILKMFPAR
ncbi:MAG: DUF1640 domain-containing protein [Magnetococcales bacterium]|nr:DUF1640 domain-containing protein [Magnetococcales bacterium]